MSAFRYTIGELAKRTGLTPHTIRAWERRYSALTPDRSEANQRLYSEEQLRKLVLLKQATDEGHPISRVAGLTIEELGQLPTMEAKIVFAAATEQKAPEILASCAQAIENLNEDNLITILNRGVTFLGLRAMLDEVIVPLLVVIGSRWHQGTIRIYQEHMATSVVRGFLANQLNSTNPRKDAPKIVVTTPRNQHHELGAVLAGIGATMNGWNVLYLGPNLPSKEIADAIHSSDAQALALSIVYPSDDATLPSELASIRHLVGPSLPIYAGGQAVDSYQDALHQMDAKKFTNWFDLGLDLSNPA